MAPQELWTRYFGMWLPPFPPASLLFSCLRNRKSSLLALVCNTLLTLWGFSKSMLTCVCCCFSLSSDVVLVNDKLRKKLSNQWNSSAPFPLLPLLSTTGAETQNALFLPPSPVCLVFISRQNSVIPVYETNASSKLSVAERLLASVEVTQRQPGCITWFHRLQAWSSCLSFYYPDCHPFENLWHLEMWSVDFPCLSVTGDVQCSLFSTGLARLV